MRCVKNVLKSLLAILIDAKNIIHVISVRTSEKHSIDRLHAETQRTVHQIEKGLSIENLKKGFGYEKADLLITYMEQMSKYNDYETKEVMDRAGSCLDSYFQYFEINGWNDEKTIFLKNKFVSFSFDYHSDPSFGGLMEIARVQYPPETFVELCNLADSRHSIRDLSSEPVDINLLKKAISFAQKSPSACNRQAVRCYIIEKSKYSDLSNWLSGIGYFGDYGFDKIVLVTGKITGYNRNEGMQHLVSPGIFVGYLVLALEALNVGGVVIQRSLYNDSKWIEARKILDIPDDEQSFCLIGCGMKKEKYKVPTSKRLSTDAIVKVIQ